MADQWDEFADAPDGVATADPFAEFKDAPAVSGTGAVFGRNMDGSVDNTDVGQMSLFNAHHGAYKGVDLTDPNMAGIAIGGQQAVQLTGIADPYEARKSMLGKVLRVFNHDNGQSDYGRVIDAAPIGQPHVEMTPAMHKLVGSDGSSNLSIMPVADEFAGFKDAPQGPDLPRGTDQLDRRIAEGDQYIQDAQGLFPNSTGPETGGQITSVNGPVQEPDEMTRMFPNEKLRHAVAAGANLIGGLVPSSLEGIKQMLAPPTYERFQEDVARSKPEYEAAEKTPPWSQERFEHYGNAALQILMAGAVGKGVLKPEPKLSDLDAKIAAAQAKYEAKPEPALTEAIRAKLGQSETRLPVEQELYPYETPAVKTMRAPSSPLESPEEAPDLSQTVYPESLVRSSLEPIPKSEVSASAVNQANFMVPPIAQEMLAAGPKSAAALRAEITNVRYGEPGQIKFEFRGETHVAPEPTDVMPAVDATGTNAEASRSWALKELLSGRAKPTGEPVPQPKIPAANESASGAGAKENITDRVQDIPNQAFVVQDAKASQFPIEQKEAQVAQPDITLSAKTMPAEEFAGVRDAHSYNGKFILDGPAGEHEIDTFGERKYYGTPEAAFKASKKYQKELASAPPPEPVVTSTKNAVTGAEPSEPRTTGIAQRVHEARFEAGTQGEVLPGKGTGAETLVKQGQADVAAGVDISPALEKVDKGQAVDPIEMSRLRATHEQLSKATDALANPKTPEAKAQYEAAFKAETNFARRIKPAATVASDVFRSLQGETDIDTGSFTGLRRAVNDLHGRDVKPHEEPILQRTADRVQKANSEAVAALQRASQNVERRVRPPKSKPRSVDELREHLSNRIKELTPC